MTLRCSAPKHADPTLGSHAIVVSSPDTVLSHHEHSLLGPEISVPEPSGLSLEHPSVLLPSHEWSSPLPLAGLLKDMPDEVKAKHWQDDEAEAEEDNERDEEQAGDMKDSGAGNAPQAAAQSGPTTAPQLHGSAADETDEAADTLAETLPALASGAAAASSAGGQGGRWEPAAREAAAKKDRGFRIMARSEARPRMHRARAQTRTQARARTRACARAREVQREFSQPSQGLRDGGVGFLHDLLFHSCSHGNGSSTEAESPGTLSCDTLDLPGACQDDSDENAEERGVEAEQEGERADEEPAPAERASPQTPPKKRQRSDTAAASRGRGGKRGGAAAAARDAADADKGAASSSGVDKPKGSGRGRAAEQPTRAKKAKKEDDH